MKNIKAVIFDMDGVLIDSELIWGQKYEKLLDLLAPNLPFSVHKYLLGRSIEGIFDYINENYEKYLKIKDKGDFYKIYEEFGMNNVYNCSNLLFDANYILDEIQHIMPLALSSSSPWSWINKSLELHNLKKYFKIIVSGQDFLKAKPDPEIYLETAEKLNLKSKNCLVIEDSDAGIMAAKNAGMHVLGLRNGFNDEQSLDKADQIIDNLKKIINIIY